MKICPNCTRENPEEAAICGFCGNDLTSPKAHVIISWTDLSSGLIEKLGVYLDGHKVGDVVILNKLEMDVEPGEHIFFVKEDFSESPRKKFLLGPGEILNLGIRSKGSSGIGNLYYMFFNPKNHLVLEKLEIKNS
jgi:hypothetical protein